MMRAGNYAILFLVAALLLSWPFHARGELVKLRAEGRIDKVDATETIDPGIQVGATFLFELSYDTEAKGTILIRGLTINSVERLTKQGDLLGRVNHSSKAGGWDRLRLFIEGRNDIMAGAWGTGAASFDVKIAFDSRTNGEPDSPATGQRYLPLNGLKILLGNDKFFHLVYSESDGNRGPDGLISGEITSLTMVDG